MKAANASEDEIEETTARAYEFYATSLSTSPIAHYAPLLPLPLDTPVPPPSEPLTTTSATSTGGAIGEAALPPYPLSFSALATLIATGEPIPGIKDIPDLLNDAPGTESTLKGGKKPWEVSEGEGKPKTD